MVFPLGERISWNKHSGHILVSVEGYDAIDCEICQFIHVVPLPSAEELEEYYRTSFYEESKPDYFDSAERDREWLNIGYDMKLEMIEEALEEAPETRKTGRRVLDIGSGPGYFLRRAEENGWSAVGLEASPAAVNFSRGLGVEVHHGYFSGAATPEGLGTFDAIHMQHVLEHAPDPAKFLDRLATLLKAGGVICIEVPNDFSGVQEILYTSMNFPAWWVAPPEHLNYWNKKSLDAFLASCGFAAKSWTSQFPIDLALIAGIDYVKNPQLGRKLHQHRVRLEQVSSRQPSLLRSIYSSLLEHGLGRELVVVAQASSAANGYLSNSRGGDLH